MSGTSEENRGLTASMRPLRPSFQSLLLHVSVSLSSWVKLSDYMQKVEQMQRFSPLSRVLQLWPGIGPATNETGDASPCRELLKDQAKFDTPIFDRNELTTFACLTTPDGGLMDALTGRLPSRGGKRTVVRFRGGTHAS